MLKAVLFDLDGTLIDSEKIHFDAWNEALSPYAVQLDFENYLNEYAGVSLIPNATKIVETYHLPVSVENFILSRQRILLGQFEKADLPFMPYAEEAIDHLLRDNITLAVVTSSSREEVDIIMRRIKQKENFAFEISRDDVGFSKPHPAPYQKCLSLLKLMPEQCIVLEDSLTGVQSAMNAGITCIAIHPISKEREKLRLHTPLVFADLHETLQYLTQNSLTS